MNKFGFARIAPAIAIAALVAGASVPALARDADNTAAAKPVASKPRATRYCQVWVPTGSIIQQKDCRTREEWIHDEGIDPTAAKY